MLTSPEIAHNVVVSIALHPMTYRSESFFKFHLLRDVDKDDDKFVDCAISADADYIVSDDRHFSQLKKIPFPKVSVITLDEFYLKNNS